MSDKLITTEIRGRKVIYYLTSKNDIEAIKTKNVFADIFLALFSIFAGAILTIFITLSASNDLEINLVNQYRSILVLLIIIGVIFLVLYLIFLTQNNSTIKDIISASPYTNFESVLPPEKALKIIEASYFSLSTTWDATKRLQNMVINNRLNTYASNELIGDPEHGKDKWLKIKYAFNGEEFIKEYIQGAKVDLP